MCASSPLARARSHGFTLVELVMTMVIISIAAVAIFTSLSFAFKHQSDGIWRTKSVALAKAYMEQALARRFDESTPVGGVPACSAATCSDAADFDDGEARGQFDDVDDFDGVDDLPPQDEAGNPLVGFDGYRVRMTVAYPDSAQITALGLSGTTDAKVVTVTVTPPGRSNLEFRSVKANF